MTATICDLCYARRKSPPFAQACAVVPVTVYPTRPGQALHLCDDCRPAFSPPARKP